MKITVLAVGKLKEAYLREAVAEYEKRLSRYGKLEIIELPDEKTPEGASEAEEEKIREKEAERAHKFLDEHTGYVIALAIEGESMDSVTLAKRLSALQSAGKSHLIFLIGGSLGLSKGLLARADLALSFSKLTFPHQLMRVLLLEQLYRAERINRNEPYHK